jgi:peroxiredoxin
MKVTYLTSVLLFLVFNACGSLSDKQIINRTIKKLNSIQTIEYIGSFVFYDSRRPAKSKEFQATCFFDFRSDDLFLAAKYIIDINGENPGQITYFDGKTVARIDRNRREIIINDNPHFYHVNSSFFVQYSIAKLRQVLPLIQNDPDVTFTRLNDTIINNIASYHFKIEMKNKSIGLDSVIDRFTDGWIARYHVAIDKSTFLPIQFGRICYEYLMITFSHIRLNQVKDDSIWHDYENFPEYYLRMNHQDWVQSIRNSGRARIDEQAIEWTLPDLQGNLVSLSDLRGNNVLLMFFFPGCQACIPAITILNELEKKYAQQELKIYGIEFTNAGKETVVNYVKDKGILFSVLYSGRCVANEYGIRGAPTFFLIDSSGTIIYSQVGLHNRDELINSVGKLF